jgi:PKD repeat protein
MIIKSDYMELKRYHSYYGKIIVTIIVYVLISQLVWIVEAQDDYQAIWVESFDSTPFTSNIGLKNEQLFTQVEGDKGTWDLSFAGWLDERFPPEYSEFQGNLIIDKQLRSDNTVAINNEGGWSPIGVTTRTWYILESPNIPDASPGVVLRADVSISGNPDLAGVFIKYSPLSASVDGVYLTLDELSQGVDIYQKILDQESGRIYGNLPFYHIVSLKFQHWNGLGSEYPDSKTTSVIVDNIGFYQRGAPIPVIPFAAFEASPTQGPAPLKVTFTDQSTGNGITSRVWKFKLNTETEWTTFTLDRKLSHTLINPGIYDVKLTVTNASGSDEELKSELLKVGCDFSIKPDTEKCFGGVGIQCEGVNLVGFPVVSFKKDERTCKVNGWMSIGSILHDKCCITSGNTGVMCANPDGSDTCQKEWDEAVMNTACSKQRISPRQWAVTFGPYFYGTEGDDVTKALTAPSGAKVNPEYQYLCQSGTCRVNNKGVTILNFDTCGFYCVCK